MELASYAAAVSYSNANEIPSDVQTNNVSLETSIITNVHPVPVADESQILPEGAYLSIQSEHAPSPKHQRDDVFFFFAHSV